MARTGRAAVLEKQATAIALYSEGASYDDIAARLGYANRGSAWKLVNRGLQVQRDLRAEDYLQYEVDRYEAVLCRWWAKATTGQDARAANIVLRVMERLDKLLRLGEGDHIVSHESIVISADPEEYVKQLREVVGEREHQARVGT